LVQQATANAEAYEEYLRGRDALGRYVYHTVARVDIDQAIEHFERAAYLDPSFALAHSALGAAYASRVMKGFGEPEDHTLAREAFDKALALDSHLIEPRMNMIFIYLSSGEKAKARAAADELKREAPNDASIHFIRGIVARLDGDYDKAMRSLDRMLRLNPAERVVVAYNRARLLTYQGRYDEALAELDQGAAVEADHPLIKTFRARALYYRGDVVKAAEILEQVLENQPQLDGIRPIYAMILSIKGLLDRSARRCWKKSKNIDRNNRIYKTRKVSKSNLLFRNHVHLVNPVYITRISNTQSDPDAQLCAPARRRKSGLSPR